MSPYGAPSGVGIVEVRDRRTLEHREAQPAIVELASHVEQLAIEQQRGRHGRGVHRLGLLRLVIAHRPCAGGNDRRELRFEPL